MQLWFIYSLVSALFQVLRNMSMKRLGQSLDDTINVWGRFTFILPFAAGAMLFNGIPELQEGVWLWCLLFGISQNLATLSLSRALKRADISLVTTLWKLSVLLLVVWGAIILGEKPSWPGVAGILLSVVGVYLLNASRSQVTWYAPLVALIKDRGQLYTLGAAFFFAPSVICIKQIALHSDPTFAIFMGYLFASVMVTPFALYTSARQFKRVPQYWADFLGLGFFSSISTIFGTTAYTMTISSYVEAVKQVEILLAMVIGWLVFKEGSRIKVIWRGSLVMLLGLVILKLWG